MDQFVWGGISKTDITQKEVETIIKEYVDNNMQDEVEEYHELLNEKRDQKLDRYADKTFVQGELMWQDMKENETEKLNIIQFNVYCRDLELANRKDWRPPTYYELLELVDYTKTEPSSVDGLKYIEPVKYWSISIHSTKKDSYWFIDFTLGTTDITSGLKKLHIRCVRELSKKRGEY